jgi:3-hydroxyisobutyrate dehydrogenase-like beta-hydroxyacid dehydrogenase
MTDITVIGLGLMGTALARAIQHASHDLTVWNRSPAKMQPFIDDNIPAAPDAAAAIAASPVVLICIDNYAVTEAMLRASDVMHLLAGRTVVQLSTGTPQDAANSADWVRAQGAAYLDGAILCGPQHIATDEAQILLCGDENAHDRTGGILACLGGRVRYLGPNIRAASALDLAWLTTCYGQFLSIIHAANMCQAEGVGVDDFIALFPDNSGIQHYAQFIHDRNFDEATATLAVWGEALKRIQRQGRDAGIDTAIPDFVASYFERAVEAGYGEKNVMSLIKLLER